MPFDLNDIFGTLQEVLPILATISGHPELGILANKLIEIGEDEIARRQSDQNRSRAEILADAQITFEDAQAENANLKNLGHETDQP